MQKSDHMYLTVNRKQTFNGSVFNFLFMHMDLCEQMVHACRCWWKPEGFGFSWTALGSYAPPSLACGAEPGSSARVAGDLNSWAISPAPNQMFWRKKKPTEEDFLTHVKCAIYTHIYACYIHTHTHIHILLGSTVSITMVRSIRNVTAKKLLKI